MKTAIWTIVILVLIGGGYYFYTQRVKTPEVSNTPTEETTNVVVKEEAPEDKTKTKIGTSVEGRDIIAYHFGEGSDELLFIGGIHGGYSWNTSLVAYQLMDYLKESSSTIPANIKVTVIPVLNPDGLSKVDTTTAPFLASEVKADAATQVEGRFNANNVDLNRNFDCDWSAEGTWQKKTVSGGAAPFSEPESQAIKKYVEDNSPIAAVVWYSAAGGVFASNCHDGVLPETSEMTKVFAKASKYKAYEDFNFYEITGDMVNWLSKSKIPAISVLLTNHTDTEWSKNKAGIDALLKHFAK